MVGPLGRCRPRQVFSFEGPIRIARSPRRAITGIRSIARGGGAIGTIQSVCECGKITFTVNECG